MNKSAFPYKSYDDIRIEVDKKYVLKGDHVIKIPGSILNTLTDEQKKKVEAAKSAEELLSIAKESCMELTDEQVEGVAGGWCFSCEDYDSAFREDNNFTL